MVHDFRLVLTVLCLWATAAGAQTGAGPVRYISDETAITLREDKGMSAEVIALLKSGTRVEVLEEDATSGYSRVRVAAGRDGWVLSRYLSPEPAARERLAEVQSRLAEQQSLVRKLQAENARLRQQGSVPAELPPPAVAAASQEDEKPAGVIDMVTGAALFIAGLLVGLIIPMLPRPGGRRRWTPEL